MSEESSSTTLLGNEEQQQQQQQQANETAPTWADADGNFSDGWLDRLPEDLEPAKATLGKYRSLPELAKSHMNLQQLLGKKSNAVTIPGEKSAPEEISAYRKAIGVPEKPEDYQLKPEKLPEGMTWSDETGKVFQTLAHKHNIPAAAMKELAGAYVEMEARRGEEASRVVQQQLESGRAELQGAWGGNYEKNLGLAARAAKTVGLDPESPGLRDPKVVQALARFASMMSEDKLVSGDFSPTDKPGKARAQAIMRGDDPALLHLHKKYTEGDPDTVKMVRSMLQHG